MNNLGYYNGNFDEIENIYIPMSDRVCFFGDGIYDATYSRNYKIFALDDHIERFFNSANLLEIDLPYTKEEMKMILETQKILRLIYHFLHRKRISGGEDTNHPA